MIALIVVGGVVGYLLVGIVVVGLALRFSDSYELKGRGLLGNEVLIAFVVLFWPLSLFLCYVIVGAWMLILLIVGKKEV